MANFSYASIQPAYTIDGIHVAIQPQFFSQARFPQTRDLTKVINGPHVTYVPCFFFWSDESTANNNAFQLGASPTFRMFWNDIKFLERMEDYYEEYLDCLHQADIMEGGDVSGTFAAQEETEDFAAMNGNDNGHSADQDYETMECGTTEMMKSRL